MSTITPLPTSELGLSIEMIRSLFLAILLYSRRSDLRILMAFFGTPTFVDGYVCGLFLELSCHLRVVKGTEEVEDEEVSSIFLPNPESAMDGVEKA